jgi:hypothetical protein
MFSTARSASSVPIRARRPAPRPDRANWRPRCGESQQRARTRRRGRARARHGANRTPSANSATFRSPIDDAAANPCAAKSTTDPDRSGPTQLRRPVPTASAPGGTSSSPSSYHPHGARQPRPRPAISYCADTTSAGHRGPRDGPQPTDRRRAQRPGKRCKRGRSRRLARADSSCRIPLPQKCSSNSARPRSAGAACRRGRNPNHRISSPGTRAR